MFCTGAFNLLNFQNSFDMVGGPKSEKCLGALCLLSPGLSMLHINICKIYLHLHLVITYFIFLINLIGNIIRILGIILILSITDAPLIQNIIESHLYVIHCLCLVLHFYLIFLV